MRVEASAAGTVQKCDRCGGTARLITPKTAPQPLYGCAACGAAFDAKGTPYTDNLKELRDYFRGATLGQKALEKGLGGEVLSPAAKSLLMAQILEYGTTMWFDGLKQGLLLGALDSNYREKTGGEV